jgi:hypothetical protein
MTINEIKAKHKNWVIAQIHFIRKQKNDMLLNKPQLRNLSLNNYNIALLEWQRNFHILEEEEKELFNNWNKGVDFIY